MEFSPSIPILHLPHRQQPPTERRDITMRRFITITTTLALAITLLAMGGTPVQAGSKASPPQSSAFGKTLPEWMQLYFEGDTDHVGKVRFLPLPSGDPIGDHLFTYDDPGTVVGHLDVCLPPASPFVLPVVVWIGETYLPSLGYPDDPALPAELFTDPSKANISVYIDGKPVMDSTRASVSPFYFGPVPLDVTYPEPTGYGSIGAIFAQGIGFVHPPLSVGTHTIALESELSIPPDGTFLNLAVYPDGVGVHYVNTWTLKVSPKCPSPPTP
jgi:hypothetical protein